MTISSRTLSTEERFASGALGLALCLATMPPARTIIRTLGWVAGAALLGRACIAKSSARPTRRLDEHTRASAAIDEAGNDSFPASDPPGSRLPDEPPGNADAKWAAAKGEEET